MKTKGTPSLFPSCPLLPLFLPSRISRTSQPMLRLRYADTTPLVRIIIILFTVTFA